jgi:SAM-dependent methyltransferase
VDPAASGYDWKFLDADAAERRAFPDARAADAAARDEPVMPRNRLRSVHEVRGPDGRRYFLKRFDGIQWKNLIRNLGTAPRAGREGPREAAVAQALRSAGHGAPRPVAVGCRGRASLLLLAEVPGAPFVDWIRNGRADRRLADRVADHCGRLLAEGFRLPDLSADHVFVDGDDPATTTLSVLDLHEGSLGPANRKTLRRVLRRFARSVAGLPVRRTAALRFALRLCRTAGLGAGSRSLVAALPPFDTHGRYDHGLRSNRYATRAPKRASREIQLLRDVWPGRDGDAILDAPCGAGRLRAPLEETGITWTGSDRSAAMLVQARAAMSAAGSTRALCRADALALPFADRSFDGVVVFRFLHHLQPAAADRAVAEACRVADRFVVVSFFHPVSTHHVQRRLSALIRGRAPNRFAVTCRTMDRWMHARGFVRRAVRAQAPFLRDLWIATYERAAP